MHRPEQGRLSRHKRRSTEGESGSKGCKEGYGESLEKCRGRRLEEEVRES